MITRPPLPLTARASWINAMSGLTPRSVWQRFDGLAFRERLASHLKRWAFVYLLAVPATAWFNAHYTVALNVTESLPVRFFLVHRGEAPKRGDYIAFRWPGGGPYRVGATFIKVIAGVPGDIVSQMDRDFYVNCRPTGQAKRSSRQGLVLEPGPTGTLPEGSYYVHAPHPDSLDSRYALTGWVSQAQIIGRAHALF